MHDKHINMTGKAFYYALFLFVPFTLWFIGTKPWEATLTSYEVMSTIARIAGIIGMCYFAGNLIISGRYKFLDSIYGGLDKLYLFHRKRGIDAFVLLTAHVTLVTAREWDGAIGSTLAFLFKPSSVAALNYGRIAYYGLAIIIIATLVRAFKKYERMKFVHQFLGAFFFFGGLHAFFIPSDIALNIPLRLYVLTLAALALISWLWRSVFKKWLAPRTVANVEQVNDLNGSVTEVVMAPVTGKMHFIPGQFMFVRFAQAGFPTEDHPFSITASTEEGKVRMSAKALGDFTTALKGLKSGAKAYIQGPFGGFSFMRSRGKKQVWIAGGIGITPFASMARTLHDRGMEGEFSNYDVHLYHSGQTADDLVYRNEFEGIEKDIKNFTFHPWISAEKGLLTAAAIKGELADFKEREFFVCGPRPMLESLKAQLNAAGIPSSHIHFELFKLL